MARTRTFGLLALTFWLGALPSIAGAQRDIPDGAVPEPESAPSEQEPAAEESVPAVPPPPGAEEDASTGAEEEASTEAEEQDDARAGDEEPLRVIVVDAAAYGVDPVVAQHVTARMRQTAEELGYDVLAAEATVAAAQRSSMHYPPAPADLWRVTYAAECQRGAFAKVWAHQGQYVTEISVASLDGTGPFFARGTSGADDLHEVVDRLTREALPESGSWDAEGAGRLRQQQEQQSAEPSGPAAPVVTSGSSPRIVRRNTREDRRPTRRWDLALQTEGAIGTSSDGFYNHLVGLRLGFRITKAIHLGLYAAYTNLRGKDGRVGNILGYLQLEDRIRITSRSDITVPLRFGIGYLPFNGAFVRFSAGVNIPLTQRIELGFDILTPTFWVLPERTAVSLNIGAELIFRL